MTLSHSEWTDVIGLCAGKRVYANVEAKPYPGERPAAFKARREGAGERWNGIVEKLRAIRDASAPRGITKY